MDEVTIIFPCYSQPSMLALQLAEWERYPEAVQVILVDDGSPQPAEPVVRKHASEALLSHLRLYRIMVDVQWNREEARNIGAKEANTDWIIQVDLDHLLLAAYIPALLAHEPDPQHWYRFPRYRRGMADGTRQKDALPRQETFGMIHPHVDSFLVRREVYWAAGGYDEIFAGVLGGGGEFLARLERTAGPPMLLSPDVCLHVVTRSVAEDASITGLSRDTAPGKAIWREKQARGLPPPTTWCRQPYERIL